MSAPIVCRPTHSMGVFLTACTCLVTHSVTLASRVCAADELPRYRFEVGKELHYQRVHEYQDPGDDNGKQSATIRRIRDWTVWITRENPNKTWRLVFRNQNITYRKEPDGEEKKLTEYVFFAYADMSTDGKFAQNDSLSHFFDIADLFPRLPPDTKSMREGWSSQDTYMSDNRRSKFAHRAADELQPDEYVFAEDRSTDLDPIYVSTRKNIYHFDQRLGLIKSVVSKSTWAWPEVEDREETCKLIAVKESSADWLSKFDLEMDLFFAATKTWDEAVAAMQRDMRSTEAQLAKAEKALRDGQIAAELALTRKLFDEQLEWFESNAKYSREDAARYLPMLGQLAPEWEAKDLDGKHRKLIDYRRKIVVLHFSNRGCGWCTRATPKLIEAAKRFADKPVAFLGMNNDEAEADARFVHDYFGIPYPTLRAQDVFKQYGINSYPAFVILDADGKIRQVRFGHSRTLGDEISDQISALLKEAQQP